MNTLTVPTYVCLFAITRSGKLRRRWDLLLNLWILVLRVFLVFLPILPFRLWWGKRDIYLRKKSLTFVGFAVIFHEILYLICKHVYHFFLYPSLSSFMFAYYTGCNIMNSAIVWDLSIYLLPKMCMEPSKYRIIWIEFRCSMFIFNHLKLIFS